MSTALTESKVEEYALEIQYESGYTLLHGYNSAQDDITPKWQNHSEVILENRLCDPLLPKLLSSELTVDTLKITNEQGV